MALEASHIRFAIDIKDTLAVTDIAPYVVGAVYPDSRYQTGVDRTLTHPNDFLTNERFWQDDFHKGWFTHLLCDQIQYDVIGEWFTDELKDLGSRETQWVFRTAIKQVQELYDLRQFTVEPYLLHLDLVRTPCGEPEEKLQAYQQSLQTIYSQPDNLSLVEYKAMATQMGVLPLISESIYTAAKRIDDTPELAQKVASIYDEIILRSRAAIAELPYA